MRVLKSLSKLHAPGHNRHLAQAIWVVFKFTCCLNAKDYRQMPQSSQASLSFIGEARRGVWNGHMVWENFGCFCLFFLQLLCFSIHILDTFNIDVEPRCSHVHVNYISAS